MYASVGKVAILKKNCATSQAFYNLVFNDINQRDFVYERLNKTLEEKEWGALVSTGTQDNLNADKVKNYSFLIPINRLEMLKISNLLISLDSLITLHQRNVFGHETYQSNKSTVSWEQRKLSEICSIKKGKQLNRDNLFIQGRYYVLNGGMTPSGYTDNYNTEENSISISEGGNSCGFVYLNKSKFWSGGHNYTLFNNFLNTDFLYQYLKSKEAFLMSLRVGSGLPNLQKTRLIETLIATTNNEEQIRITSLLTSLDSLITLHQRKRKCILD